MAEKTSDTFGNFVGIDEGEIMGRLALSFHSEALDLDELWDNSTLSAKFLSMFWGKFFPKHDKDSGQTRKQVEDEIMYVASELLGNAVKFSYQPDFLAEIGLYLHKEELRFYVSNSVGPDHIGNFKAFINKILTEDTTMLFLEQMEKSAEEGSDESGVGFLTLINDYDVELSWKFEKNRSGVDVVTTLARMPISWEQ